MAQKHIVKGHFLKKKKQQKNPTFIPQERKVTLKEKIVLFTGTVFYSVGI